MKSNDLQWQGISCSVKGCNSVPAVGSRGVWSVGKLHPGCQEWTGRVLASLHWSVCTGPAAGTLPLLLSSMPPMGDMPRHANLPWATGPCAPGGVGAWCHSALLQPPVSVGLLGRASKKGAAHICQALGQVSDSGLRHLGGTCHTRWHTPEETLARSCDCRVEGPDLLRVMVWQSGT